MTSLTTPLRRQLEGAVKQARKIAEAGARHALTALAVHEPDPYRHMDEGQRALRRRLRAQGRQLGDGESRSKPGSYEIRHLAEKLAYDQWHRILFARYLLENDLLISPEHGVAVTLDDCEELAPSLGVRDAWGVAASFAAKSLPEIFRADDPAGAVELSINDRKPLIDLVTGLPAAVFTASDSLGWCYQFWQAEKKDEVNASGNKIGADELPAVTQLFTEPYMVSFLLDNSLGAWWAARRLSAADLKNANSEEELRQKAAIPGVPLEYLRFVRVEDGLQDTGTVTGADNGGRWTPAAGTFAIWPEQLADLKTLDPCCGSGHFLVAAFLMLVPLRMERDGLPAQAAVDAVLRENIHGLELDQRCVELAAFALALTAWKYPGAGGYRVLPKLNVACSGLSVSVAKEEWKKLGLGKQNLALALGWMHDTFRDAPVLGSLLNPAKTDAAKLVQWDELSTALDQALQQEQSDEQQEAAVVAQGLAKAAALLAGRYQWVITNVPYLARGKQDERLRKYCENHYPTAKNDLATVFLDRCLELCVEGGTASVVLPQNWLSQTSYKKFREKLLKNDTWRWIARLGPQAFQTPMWDFNVQLITLDRGNSARQRGGLFGGASDQNLIRGVDVSEPRTAAEKIAQLVTAEVKSVEQVKQLENTDSRIAFSGPSKFPALAKWCTALMGSGAGDRFRFVRNFWEVSLETRDFWEFHQTTPSKTAPFAGREEVILWEHEKGEMYQLAESVKHLNHKAQQWRSGKPNWGKYGVVISLMANLPASLYTGEIYATKCTALVPSRGNESILVALWAFCSSSAFVTSVREINQRLAIEVKEVLEIPFDLDHWTKVAEEKYPNGMPKPYTDDPTQWIFHGHPGGSVIWAEEKKLTAHGPQRVDATVLQVAVARLLGYRWPAELDISMKLADEQREWVSRCEPLLPHSDRDGIVCLSASKGEAPAAERLRTLLAQALGNYDLTALLASAGTKGSKSETLESWLRDEFFEQHCTLFHHRPFIWHIWDGHKSGFSALVNYHKLTHANLEKLTYAYLGDWLRRQQAEVDAGEAGSDARLQAAKMLQARLKLILEGEPPYDIFVRWKPLSQQAIGWQPDLNDGVRLNFRPFLAQDIPGGKKGAGILRAKPNIKWDKDRGKEPVRDKAEFPWFWNWDGKSQDFTGQGKEPDGNRWNDCHYSNAMKRAARVNRP